MFGGVMHGNFELRRVCHCLSVHALLSCDLSWYDDFILRIAFVVWDLGLCIGDCC